MVLYQPIKSNPAATENHAAQGSLLPDQWRVLDTCFDQGQHFLATWAAWQADASRPPLLHYVALVEQPTTECPVQPLTHSAASIDLTTPWVQELQSHWWGLLPGVHRIRLAQGRVLLTLLIASDDKNAQDQKGQEHKPTHPWHQAALILLRNQATPVNMILWHGSLLAAGADADTPSDTTQASTTRLNTLKALARYCRKGTRLISLATTNNALPQEDAALRQQCGFIDTTKPAITGTTSATENPAYSNAHHAVFAPHWLADHNENSPPLANAIPRTCVVIGGGISGAAVAHVLALRGWKVTVIDAATTPANGASGLPVGLTAPHASPDDNTLSRLTRSGLRCTLHYAQQHLTAGQDWAPTGVLEHCVDGKWGLPQSWLFNALKNPADNPENNTAAISHDWSHPANNAHLQQAHLPSDSTALWHPRAAWLRPVRLATALLQQPGITWLSGQKVHSVQPVVCSTQASPRQDQRTSSIPTTAADTSLATTQWQILDADNHTIAQAPLVVIAAGWNSSAWLPQGVRLNPLRGQVSWAWHTLADTPNVSTATTKATVGTAPSAPWPPFPVNGKGSVIGHIPLPNRSDNIEPTATAWFVGATFERATHSLPPSPQDQQLAHATNGAKLQQLLPALGQHLAPQFTAVAENDTAANHADHKTPTNPCFAQAAPAITSWAGVRCTSHDRLPLVGAIAPAQPGLWVCTAMGARGLTLAMLCAELLAARLHQEPLPMDAALAQALDAARWA